MVRENNFCCEISSKKIYAASLGITSILFLWSIQIFYRQVGVPLYLVTSIFFIYFSRFTRDDITMFIAVMSCLFLLLFLQKLQGIVLSTPFRTIVAIPSFSFIVVCSYRWLNLTLKDSNLGLFRVFRFFLLGQLLVQLCQLFAWVVGLYAPRYQQYLFDIPRVTGFFNEPSHVAFSLSPFIYLGICHRKLAIKWLGKIGLVSLGLTFILCSSATLIGIIAIAFFVRLIQKCRSFPSVVASISWFFLGCSFLILLIFYIPALSQRFGGLVDIVSGAENLNTATNLSALMFIKGWQMALGGLQHYPLGVGFLNFQILNELSSVSFLSDTIWELNAMGGTSVGFKLIGEYGYLGLIVVVFSFIIFLKNIHSSDYRLIIENFFLFGLFGSFLRGASYFDGTPILAFAILYKRFHLYIICYLKQCISINLFPKASPQQQDDDS